MFIGLGIGFILETIPLVHSFCNLLIRFINNCAIYSETKIGKSTTFGYAGICVVIYISTIIGENFFIGTNVTTGGLKITCCTLNWRRCLHCYGAKVLGTISIGNNCVIGCHCSDD
jgi:serine O-acetyltransferase